MKAFGFVAVAALVSAHAMGACTITATNFCVQHNGIAFVINGTARAPVTLTAGTTYTFTLNNTSAIHPFYITTSSTGAGVGQGSVANVTPNTPQTGNAVITFTPSMAQVGQTVFYQCANHLNMGASITIVAPPCPADFNHDGHLDFFDYLDFVDAFSAQQPAADFNHDSSIDFFDYLDFVDAFSHGC